jgi:hypothetical protein
VGTRDVEARKLADEHERKRQATKKDKPADLEPSVTRKVAAISTATGRTARRSMTSQSSVVGLPHGVGHEEVEAGTKEVAAAPKVREVPG